MLIVTTNDLAGMEIEKVLGLVSGSATVGIGVGRAMAASWAVMRGSASKAMTAPADEAEALAMKVMVEKAEALGADAVVAVRMRTLDTAEQTAGVAMYGTAVKVMG